MSRGASAEQDNQGGAGADDHDGIKYCEQDGSRYHGSHAA